MAVVGNELLGYPKYVIFQDSELFHFSIDSMLLADFVTLPKKAKKVADLCAGNAPISMFLTLRTGAHIDAVEIQDCSFQLAQKSVSHNALESQITLHHQDVKGIHKRLGHQAYDVVVCNPPFFKWNENSNTNKNDFLTIARHEVLITLDDIVHEARLLLNNGGYFAMVHRPDRLLELLASFQKHHIEPKRLRFVYPKKGEKANHVLIEGIKAGNKGGLKVLAPLIIHKDNNQWTAEVKKIYNYKEGK